MNKDHEILFNEYNALLMRYEKLIDEHFELTKKLLDIRIEIDHLVTKMKTAGIDTDNLMKSYDTK